MNLNNISAWSIRNPVVPIVLFVALTIAGIVSFMNMDVQNDPDIEFPVVVVSISQPGAAPTEITTQITQKVESAIRSVQGVRNIDASSSEGNTTVSAEFEIGLRDENNDLWIQISYVLYQNHPVYQMQRFWDGICNSFAKTWKKSNRKVAAEITAHHGV